MQNLETYERVMLRDLFTENDFLDIYFFHQKYLLSHQQIYDVLEKYAQYFDVKKIETGINQLIIKVKLNEKGRLQVWQNRFKYFRTDIRFLDKNKKDVSTQNFSLNVSDKSLKYIQNKIGNRLLLALFSSGDTNN